VITGARLTYDVTLVKTQVILFEDLEEISMPETVSTACTEARLCPNHRSSQDVIASVAELPVGAVAALPVSGVGDAVGVLAVQARDGVATATVGEGDLLEVHFGEGEGP
jgi:hypothetical protein